MKKTLIAILALAALAACNKTEVVDLKAPQAIAFESPFVDNSTKAIDNTYSTTNLPESFKVYGTLTNSSNETVNIFNGVEVIKALPTGAAADGYISGTDTWYYADDYVQYWMDGNKYNFAAVVGATLAADDLDDNGMPKTIDYTVSSQADLLYDRPEEISYTSSTSTNVAFTLDHLLSKVVFKFTNGYATDTKFYVKIDDVAIVNAAKAGTYTIATTPAWSSTEDASLSFGPALSTSSANATLGDYIAPGTADVQSNYAKLLVPETQIWNIAFTANVYYYKSGTADAPKYTLVNKFEYTAENPLKTSSIALEAGKSYSFNITIGGTLQPITFSATASDWTDGTTTELSLQ